jgi:hypothetical protein
VGGGMGLEGGWGLMGGWGGWLRRRVWMWVEDETIVCYSITITKKLIFTQTMFKLRRLWILIRAGWFINGPPTPPFGYRYVFSRDSPMRPALIFSAAKWEFNVLPKSTTHAMLSNQPFGRQSWRRIVLFSAFPRSWRLVVQLNRGLIQLSRPNSRNKTRFLLWVACLTVV